MQPTFLPWLGYFAMIERADEFVFLDSVPFAGSWQQRNRIKTPQGPQWLTVPVHGKGLRDQLIRDVRIDEPVTNLTKLARSVTLNYARAPHFDRYGPGLLSILENPPTMLADLTIALIGHLMAVIGITSPCLRSSALPVRGAKADLLADICEHRGAVGYISAPGSREYLGASPAMAVRGIEVIYHEYQHPVYPQMWGAFAPYLSVVDLLFNVGPASLVKIREGLCSPAGGAA